MVVWVQQATCTFVRTCVCVQHIVFCMQHFGVSIIILMCFGAVCYLFSHLSCNCANFYKVLSEKDDLFFVTLTSQSNTPIFDWKIVWILLSIVLSEHCRMKLFIQWVCCARLCMLCLSLIALRFWVPSVKQKGPKLGLGNFKSFWKRSPQCYRSRSVSRIGRKRHFVLAGRLLKKTLNSD